MSSNEKIFGIPTTDHNSNLAKNKQDGNITPAFGSEPPVLRSASTVTIQDALNTLSSTSSSNSPQGTKDT